MKSLCLTCIHLPRLEPCKTLTGPTMQYSGRCDLRPPTSPDNTICGDDYTPLWIDFERRCAWEDAGSNISECAAYKCTPSLREPLADQSPFDLLTGLIRRWHKAYTTYSVLAQPKKDRPLKYNDKVPYEPPGALANDTSEAMRKLKIKED